MQEVPKNMKVDENEVILSHIYSKQTARNLYSDAISQVIIKNHSKGKLKIFDVMVMKEKKK